MLNPKIKIKPHTDEWFANRNITATNIFDIAKMWKNVGGVEGKFLKRYDLYRKFHANKPIVKTNAMDRGHIAEAKIKEKLKSQYGELAFSDGYLGFYDTGFEDTKYLLGATPDLIFTDGKIGEIKSCFSDLQRLDDRKLQDDFQTQWQMFIFDTTYCTLFVQAFKIERLNQIEPMSDLKMFAKRLNPRRINECLQPVNCILKNIYKQQPIPLLAEVL